MYKNINSMLKTSKVAFLLSPSDVYVRSFLYLFYNLIKLYYTKALSDQASSLALDRIPLFWRPQIPALFPACSSNISKPSVSQYRKGCGSLFQVWELQDCPCNHPDSLPSVAACLRLPCHRPSMCELNLLLKPVCMDAHTLGLSCC